jgi:hypothetical protein
MLERFFEIGKIFEYTIVRLESVFDIVELNPNLKVHEPHLDKDMDYKNQVIGSSEINAQRLEELLKYPSDLCANKEDLIYYLKKWVLLDFALTFGYTKLLQGCSALTVATRVMSEISKGRGLSLSNSITFVDERYFNDIKFMNPMKDFIQKEIAAFNKYNKVKLILQLNLCLKAKGKSKTLPGFGNMNFLCEEFITNLQDKSNPQTVHTVLRTSNKLKIGDVEDEEHPY